MPEKREEMESAAQRQGDLASLTKAAGKFIGWLSGSLAAITGIFYGLGYLVTLSNLHSLGLDFYLFSFDPSLYLTRGANFVLYFARTMAQILFLLIILISPFLALGFLLYRYWLKGRFVENPSKAINYIRQHPVVWKGPIFVALAGILFFDLWDRYVNFSAILGISQILYDPQIPSSIAENEAIQSAIWNKGPESDKSTDSIFIKSQLFLIEATLLLYLTWRLTSAWRFRLLLVAPFALVFAMFVITFPMIFGILIISNEFSTIHVTTNSGSEVSRSDELYLLSKSDREFILWNNDSREVLWLPLGSVTRAEIGARKALRARRRSDSEKAPE